MRLTSPAVTSRHCTIPPGRPRPGSQTQSRCSVHLRGALGEGLRYAPTVAKAVRRYVGSASGLTCLVVCNRMCHDLASRKRRTGVKARLKLAEATKALQMIRMMTKFSKTLVRGDAKLRDFAMSPRMSGMQQKERGTPAVASTRQATAFGSGSAQTWGSPHERTRSSASLGEVLLFRLSRASLASLKKPQETFTSRSSLPCTVASNKARHHMS